MPSSVDDFVRRITRMNRKFSFIFTEDFFLIEGKTGINTNRYLMIHNLVRRMHHNKGSQAEMRAKDEQSLFDVRVIVVHTYGCFTTSFHELASEPFGDQAVICGYGGELVDAQKAKLLVDTFFADRKENTSQTVTTMLGEQRGRQLIQVAESPADLKRPSFEPIRNLRSKLATILISPTKGPIVDCQVMTVFQEGNSNTLSALLNNFCVKY